MITVGQFPKTVREIAHDWITLSDGCRLAYRMWLPDDAGDHPVPAILEYLPYRKRDGTEARDALTHPYLAGHGYACIRVDLRGNGESDGLMWDEYLVQEQDDAIEVINWIAAQPWCTGKIGMMGISWGGFNGLQVAARNPEPLKAVITLCSTVDRYADDIHYKGGAMLLENLGWSSTIQSYSTRPPDPALYGSGWREAWMHRLENQPLLIETWLSHQRRDDYWRHGSVSEDYSRITAAVLSVGGWGDAYRNCMSNLLSGLRAPCKAITGPWVHKYPHFAVPHPQIGFLQEALRWWDQWLKGIETGIMNEPDYRAYLMDSVEPAEDYLTRPGRWIGEPNWPSPEIEPRPFFLAPSGLKTEQPGTGTIDIQTPETVGAASGEYCAIWLGPEWPGDQRADDEASVTFDSDILTEDMEVFGAADLTIDISADQPQANLIARLCDVRPDGTVARVSYGILNLTHRENRAHPAALNPGEIYRVTLKLDDIAYSFPKGHKVRLALSNSYWPLIWPSPHRNTLTAHFGESRLFLPVRQPRDDDKLITFKAAEGAPARQVINHRPDNHQRAASTDKQSGRSTLIIEDDFGENSDLDAGFRSGSMARERYEIDPDDPISARASTEWHQTFARDELDIRTEAVSHLYSDEINFYVEGRVSVTENDQIIHEKSWKSAHKRDFI